MFTGIVTDVGTLVGLERRDRLRRLSIACGYPAGGIAVGASIACPGICLTVVEPPRPDAAGGSVFVVEAAAETLAVTTLGSWEPGRRINLERALKIGDELGGHIVTGHVDGLATVVSREEMTPGETGWGATLRFWLEAPAPLARFIAAKGSVCLDGTSLTVNAVEGTRFSILLIPHTVAVTTWRDTKAGDTLNLEIDLMARYAARLAETASG